MRRSLVETLMGAVVIAVAVAFVVFAYTRSSVATVEGYHVTAKFTRIDGLLRGSDVRIGGIKVGSVISQDLDPKTYQAVVRLSVARDIELPTDSTAAVVSDGLLGGKYLNIEPGGAEDFIKPGGEIQYTQSSIMLEQLIGKFAFGNE